MTSEGLFISYRRQDAGGHAGRLADRLAAAFGADTLFMDVQDIRPGQNFATAIEDTLGRCTHLLAVIGPRWLELLRERSQAPEDLVSQEIAVALGRGLTVVPVLVGGARMPASDDLPAPLALLARCQAVEVRDDRFDDDCADLIQALGRDAFPSLRRRSRRVALVTLALAAGVAAVAGVWYTTRPSQVLTGTWTAQMAKPGREPYRIRLELTESGARLAGAVSYPTGDASIVEGAVAGDRFSFTTEHVPQFASAPARIRFEGTWQGPELLLTAVDEGGVARGTATRAEGPPVAPGP